MDIDENLDIKVDFSLLKEKILHFTKKLENERNYLNKENLPTIKIEDEKYENLSDQYISEYSTKNSKFIQYSNSYFQRLYEIKPSLQKLAREKWSTFKVCENILDIKGKVNLLL